MAMQIASGSQFVLLIWWITGLVFIRFANVMQPGKDEGQLIISVMDVQAIEGSNVNDFNRVLKVAIAVRMMIACWAGPLAKAFEECIIMQ